MYPIIPKYQGSGPHKLLMYYHPEVQNKFVLARSDEALLKTWESVVASYKFVDYIVPKSYWEINIVYPTPKVQGKYLGYAKGEHFLQFIREVLSTWQELYDKNRTFEFKPFDHSHILSASNETLYVMDVEAWHHGKGAIIVDTSFEYICREPLFFFHGEQKEIPQDLLNIYYTQKNKSENEFAQEKQKYNEEKRQRDEELALERNKFLNSIKW